MSNVKELIFPGDCRILVCGDNHGNPDLLQSVLNQVNYTNNDHLILLGDMIEKGPDCIGALQLAYSLCSKNQNAVMLLGNVDRWAKRLFFGDIADALSYNSFRPNNTLSQAAARYGFSGVTAENYEEISRRFKEEFGEVLDWYFHLPYAFESVDFIFTHSGIGEGEDVFSDRKLLFSNYDFHENRHNETGKWLFVGHMPCYALQVQGASHCPVIDNDYKIVFTDGGTIIATGQQNLCIIEKHNNAYTFSSIFADRFAKKVVVKEAFGDISTVIPVQPDCNDYELVERGDDFSKVLLPKRGVTGLAKNEFLTGGKCNCELNAFLPVKPGDNVRVMRDDLSGYAYVKREDGQIGFIPSDCLGGEAK